jgi:rubredoxin
MRYYSQDLGEPAQPSFDGLPNTDDLDEGRKHWHCPSCKKQKLSFISCGNWD